MRNTQGFPPDPKFTNYFDKLILFLRKIDTMFQD